VPTYEFPTPAATSLYVEVGRGDVRVTCTDTATTTVVVEGRDADRGDVHERDGQIEVVAPRGGLLSAFDGPLHVSVTLPLESNLATKLGSADARVEGEAGAVRLRTGSGDVRVESLTAASTIDTGSGDVRVERSQGDLKIRTGSGDVTLDLVVGELAVSTGSGDVHLGRSEAATLVKTGSGDLRVDASAGDVTFTSGSGGLAVGRTHRGRVSGKSASGDVRVGIPAGTPVWTDISSLTGRIHSTLSGAGAPAEGQDHVEVRATTVSGNVSLVEL
jgi:DUF4097 and DUF4098 domain-containing protein YvlB